MKAQNNLAYWKSRLISAQAMQGCFPCKPNKENEQMCAIQVEKLERIAFGKAKHELD
jgi:hypothetical protein